MKHNVSTVLVLVVFLLRRFRVRGVFLALTGCEPATATERKVFSPGAKILVMSNSDSEASSRLKGRSKLHR